MITTRQFRRPPGGFHANARTAVTADIDQRVDFAGFAPDDDHRLARKLEQEVVARVRNLALVAGI